MSPCRATIEPLGTAGNALRELLDAEAALTALVRVMFPAPPTTTAARHLTDAVEPFERLRRAACVDDVVLSGSMVEL